MSRAREWKYGDLASVVAEWRSGTEPYRELAHRDDEGWTNLTDGAYVADENVADARPVIAVDPEDPDSIERIVDTPAMCGLVRDQMISRLRNAFRELTKVQNPPEPTERGARVRDVEGREWWRVTSRPEMGRPWATDDWTDAASSVPRFAIVPYVEIDVAEVLP